MEAQEATAVNHWKSVWDEFQKCKIKYYDFFYIDATKPQEYFAFRVWYVYRDFTARPVRILLTIKLC